MDVVANIWKNNGGGHYTKKDQMYLNQLKEKLPDFKGGNILEIGPGEGKFAELLFNKFDVNSYTILDIEKNISDSINYLNKLSLGNKVHGVFAQNYKVLFNTEFDLIVSNICIPETPKEYREDLLNNIIPNCKYSMIIGQMFGPWTIGDEYEKWIKSLFSNNFNAVTCDLIKYKECYVLTGQK